MTLGRNQGKKVIGLLRKRNPFSPGKNKQQGTKGQKNNIYRNQ